MSPASPGQITGKVKDDNLRMDFFENGKQPEGSMIYRGDKKEIIMINHNDKTYMILDQAAMDALAKQLEQVMSQMNEAMKNMPPDQRAKMEEMLLRRR